MSAKLTGASSRNRTDSMISQTGLQNQALTIRVIEAFQLKWGDIRELNPR